MLIQCTNKLLDQLDALPKKCSEEKKFFSWHANLIRLNRKKTVVLMNDENKYILVLYGLKVKDFMELDKLIIQAVRETFQSECIKDEIIEEYINSSPEVVFTKTNDRSSVAKLNNSCSLVKSFEALIEDEKIVQSAISARVNRALTGSGPKRYIRPNKELYKKLEEFTGKPIFSCKALVLKVTLDLKNHDVWRKIVVPVHFTFERFHKVLQAAFGWSDSHLYEFYIFSDEKYNNASKANHPGFHREGYKPVLNLVSNEEAAYELSNKNIPTEMEIGKKLSEYDFSRMKYIYDFGDNWEHYIEVEKIIDDYDKNYPICFDGEGNTPPEDIGGEGGYKEFLNMISEIKADEEHPEHEYIKEWAENLGYKEFDIKAVNEILKRYDR